MNCIWQTYTGHLIDVYKVYIMSPKNTFYSCPSTQKWCYDVPEALQGHLARTKLFYVRLMAISGWSNMISTFRSVHFRCNSDVKTLLRLHLLLLLPLLLQVLHHSIVQPHTGLPHLQVFLIAMTPHMCLIAVVCVMCRAFWTMLCKAHLNLQVQVMRQPSNVSASPQQQIC